MRVAGQGVGAKGCHRRTKTKRRETSDFDVADDPAEGAGAGRGEEGDEVLADAQRPRGAQESRRRRCKSLASFSQLILTVTWLALLKLCLDVGSGGPADPQGSGGAHRPCAGEFAFRNTLLGIILN